MILLLTLANLLVLNDPIGDALGDGTLTPPTAAVLETVGGFDLETVEVLAEDTLAVRVGLVSIPSQLTLIEVYLDTLKGGVNATLPGSGMVLPSGSGWEYALQITGDGATAFLAPSPNPGAEEESPYDEFPVVIDRSERTLTVWTPFDAPERVQVYALVGLYDPFGATPWRPLASQPSPWAFSSPDDAIHPAVDLLAVSDAAQRAAIKTGTLPSPGSPRQWSFWMVVMILGLLLALSGVALRVLLPGSDPPQGAAANKVRPELALDGREGAVDTYEEGNIGTRARREGSPSELFTADRADLSGDAPTATAPTQKKGGWKERDPASRGRLG